MCCLPNCRFQMFMGNVEELLQNLDFLCFTYQHVDGIYTLFKYRLSGQSIQKTSFCFLPVHTRNILWARSTALLNTITKCAVYPTADFKWCWVTLKSCFRNWTYCVLHTSTWTVSLGCLSIDSVEKLLSRTVESLISRKKQSILIK